MYSKEKIKGVFWHHFGGTINDPLASTLSHTAETVDVSHETRWPGFQSEFFKNEKGEYFHVGYTFVIEVTNKRYIKTREIGETTAAAIGYNKGYIHVGISGNYDVGADKWEEGTNELVRTVWAEIQAKCPHLRVSDNWPHRKVANKSCFGNSLSDDHIQLILSNGQIDRTVSMKKQIITLLLKQISLLRMLLAGKRYSSKEKRG